jgi:hypothetical protein
MAAKSRKQEWTSLSHADRVRVLANSPLDQITRDYSLKDHDAAGFEKHLARERALWEATNVKSFEFKGAPPTKDVVLGAWRDLDRSEALLELIDNSIDAWLTRRQKYPTQTSKDLNIYIDLEPATGQLTYEDNAGGVSVDKLENLVVPGFSETTALSHTIGSYKTGGKKAIFRLATAARITTRYLNPAGTTDEAVSVQLDDDWMNDPVKYEFPFARLKDKSVIEKGQTRYVLQLREEPVGAPWFSNPHDSEAIKKEIRTAYSLLFARNPNIHLFFDDRTKQLQPDESLYRFSSTHDGDIDIRPQRITFTMSLAFEGKQYPVAIELVLGCRTTTGVKEGNWGIDLYGNNRLFVECDQELFSHWLLSSSGRGMIRGYINIRGPNVFIPWDTHKRHLNVDREIVRIVTSHPFVREFIGNWDRAYKDISGLGKGQVTKLISKAQKTTFDPNKHDLVVAHSHEVDLNPGAKRRVSLPKNVFVPKVKQRVTKNGGVKVTIAFAASEARILSSRYGLESKALPKGLAQAIKDEVLAGGSLKKKRRR